ncbi:MAG: hypothetical protein IJV00_04260 [Clostridia bacterium]|nr:hypothetical protein [Clostridia bacterium]
MKSLKALLAALVIIAAFAAGGCKENKKTTPLSEPEETVAAFLDALKEGDFDKAEDYILIDENEVFFFGMDDRQFELYQTVGLSADSVSLLFRYSGSIMQYKLTFCEIASDTAQVRSYVRLLNGKDFLTSVYGGLYQAFVAAGLNGTEYPDTRAYVEDRIVQEIALDPPDTAEMIASFELKNVSGKWLIKPNADVCSVMTASLFDDPDSLESALKQVGMWESE